LRTAQKPSAIPLERKQIIDANVANVPKQEHPGKPHCSA
jgi:hypothetical protein